VLKAESMAMVATDGHRLAHIEKLGEQLEGISGEKKTLIPRKALSELLSLLNATDVPKDKESRPSSLPTDEQTLFFRVGGRRAHQPASSPASSPIRGRAAAR